MPGSFASTCWIFGTQGAPINCRRWRMWLSDLALRNMADAGDFVTCRECYAGIKDANKVDDGPVDPAASECDRGLSEEFSEG